MQTITDRTSRPAANAQAFGASNLTFLGKATVASWPDVGNQPSKEVTFAPGQTLFFDGDEAKYFFEVMIGTIRCSGLTPDGRRQIFRFVSAGDMLGLSGEELHSYSAEAVNVVVVRRHRLSSLNTAMIKDHQLRERVLQSLRDELLAVRTQMTLLGQMGALEKVASFLINLFERTAHREEWLRLPLTRCDIADYLGLTVETVSRKINKLKRLGVIEMKAANEIRLIDLDRLNEFAEAA